MQAEFQPLAVFFFPFFNTASDVHLEMQLEQENYFFLSVSGIEIHSHHLVLCIIHIYFTRSGYLIRNIFDQSPAMWSYRLITACS